MLLGFSGLQALRTRGTGIPLASLIKKNPQIIDNLLLSSFTELSETYMDNSKIDLRLDLNSIKWD